MDKQRVKQTMLDLERRHFDASRDDYQGFLSSARLPSREPIESDELAQAEFASDLSGAFDQPVHVHADKLAKLEKIDFGPKQEVEEGAIVKVLDRWFVIAVATDRFVCDGTELMGVSLEAPFFAALEGKSAGETCTFDGRELTVTNVI